MNIFKRRDAIAEEPDLSDGGLGLIEEESLAEGTEVEAAEAEQQGLDGEGMQAAAEATADPPEAAAAWDEATASVSRHWPQAREDMPALVQKMVEISSRYGDPLLWQRAPAGIMREAAVELFGMPSLAENNALAAAIRQAHQQGMREATASLHAKSGLAAPQSKAAPTRECAEDQILREMRSARTNGIF